MEALAHASDYSQAFLGELRERLEQDKNDFSPFVAIGVGGSLGRHEATAVSDVDSVLIVDTSVNEDSHETRKAVARFFDLIAELGLQAPKPDGIYRHPISRERLLDVRARGSLREPPAVFGKRIQILLDVRGVYGSSAFYTLQQELLEWYGARFLDRTTGSGQWAYLLNDLMRYLHSYAAWQQFKFDKSPSDGWYLRQLKLRSSRAITIAGLVFLLAEYDGTNESHKQRIMERLTLSPLERVADVINRYDPDYFSELASTYDSVLARLSDADHRAELVRLSPATLEQVPDTYPVIYQQAYDISAHLLSMLANFVIARRSDWSPVFYAYLIF